MGCDTSVDLPDELDVQVQQQTFYVDTYCANGGCEDDDVLECMISLDAQTAVAENDSVQLLQYRVDFQIPQLNTVVPFFAAPLDVNLQKGDETTVDIRMAGIRQKEFILQQVGRGPVSGVSRVTLAGHDEMEEVVFYKFNVNIAFGDFISDAVATPAAPRGE